MHLNKSHGGLSFPRIGILIAAFAGVAAGAGIYLGSSATELRQDGAAFARLHELSAQNRVLANALMVTINGFRAQALSLQQVREAFRRNGQMAMPEPTGNILHWAELEIHGNRSVAVKQVARNAEWKNSWPNGIEAFEDFYLQMATASPNLREISPGGQGVLRVRQDPQRTAEWLAFGFAVPGGTAQSRSVVLALVDPKTLFAGIRQITASSPDGQLRAYLIGSDGRVLAHSQGSYEGADFSDLALFKNGIRGLMLGTSVAGAGEFHAIDQLPVLAAYSRPAGLPMGVVLEEVGGRAERVQAGFFDLMGTPGVWQRMTGQILAVLGILSVLVFGAFSLIWRRRKEIRQIDEEPQTVAAALAEAAVPAVEVIPENAEVIASIQTLSVGEDLRQELHAARVELHSAQLALQAARKENQLLNQFEKEAAYLRDPRKIGQKLVTVASQLCGSPTLFFVYHERLRTAVLQADAGFVQGEAPAGLSFPVSAELLQELVESDRRGQIASLASYEPLSKTLMMRLGISHVEAWAITGYGHIGRQAGRPRLLGVIVVLQPGLESLMHQESLNRMLRTTGLIYENTLLSQ